ncbi:MAG: TIGR00266 family protein, partial [Anaerolineae bacterium]|nr:TIGR00266 family protein [Anaerolineae bacterium]
MDIEILYKPSYSMGVLKLAGGEQVRVEGGSMVGMSHGVTLETKASGGILKSLARSVLGGESFFQNIYNAPAQGGEVSVAPALPGDLVSVEMNNESLMVQSGSYVASDMGIELDTQWGGAKTFFASEGLIMLRASGTGKLVLSSYGAIHEITLGAGETYTVDTGHLVAFTQ